MMYLSWDNMGAFLALLILVLSIWFWANSMRAREQAIEICTQICRRQNAQLLDDTVALRRLRYARDDNGRITWRRSYDFEYSKDGVLRLHGNVILRGHRLEILTMDTPEGTVQIEQIAPPE